MYLYCKARLDIRYMGSDARMISGLFSRLVCVTFRSGVEFSSLDILSFTPLSLSHSWVDICVLGCSFGNFMCFLVEYQSLRS